MSAPRASGGPARHELPEIDAAALAAARHADRLLAAARASGSERWARFLAPLPDRLRDEAPAALRRTAARARAAFGPKDSIRDALPDELTLPFRDALDALGRVLAAHDRRA
ncbi:MAG: hypothetical protein ACYDAK_10430 [Candidatus Limnocylindrales bacterium]